jgi:tRNA nucleotidyltransferase (CCA-adding enzyme)
VVNDQVSESIEKKEEDLKNLDEKKISYSVNNTEDGVNNNVIHDIVKQIVNIREEILSLKTLRTIEVTPYRVESKYSDNRRPDQVEFSKKLEDDLKRRDFTINAFCYNPSTNEIIDLFEGISDLQKKELKCIGSANERFEEDALRMLRAVRFSAQLGFNVTRETSDSIVKNKDLLKNVSNERIRDEFIKILLSDNPIKAFFLAKDLEILGFISKDLEKGIGIEQNGAHLYDVFEHLVRTMQHSADRKWSLDVRLASLFHDISKPETRR